MTTISRIASYSHPSLLASCNLQPTASTDPYCAGDRGTRQFGRGYTYRLSSKQILALFRYNCNYNYNYIPNFKLMIPLYYPNEIAVIDSTNLLLFVLLSVTYLNLGILCDLRWSYGNIIILYAVCNDKVDFVLDSPYWNLDLLKLLAGIVSPKHISIEGRDVLRLCKTRYMPCFWSYGKHMCVSRSFHRNW